METLAALHRTYRIRMARLRRRLYRKGCLRATRRSDPGYMIFLCANPAGPHGTPWRVTSFRDGEPIGHREYDRLEGGAPAQNALAEFIGSDWSF